MWSPTKLDFPFYDFIVIYSDFFKDSARIIKRKKKTKPPLKPFITGFREVKCIILKVKGDDLLGVQRKTVFCESGGKRGELFPFYLKTKNFLRFSIISNLTSHA